MLNNRILQFREYNKLEKSLLANMLGITEEEYSAYEDGTMLPGTDTIEKLSLFYKVTVNEFYGHTPLFTLHSDDNLDENNKVDERILKMSDLSWDEAQLILYYRQKGDKDEIIKKIIEENF